MYSRFTAATLLLSLAFYAGTAEAGRGKSGRGNSDAATTTFTVGQITISDAKITDLTGSYTFESPDASVHVNIVQGPEGDLVADATLSGGAGSTEPALGPFTMEGELSASRRAVRFELEGEVENTFALEDADSEDSDDDSEDIEVEIRGVLVGSSFQVVVSIEHSHELSFNSTLTAETTSTTIVIGDAQSYLDDQEYESIREGTFAGAAVTLEAEQKNRREYVKFEAEAEEADLEIKLFGFVTGDSFVTLKAKVDAGYGSFYADPASVQVTASAFAAIAVGDEEDEEDDD